MFSIRMPNVGKKRGKPGEMPRPPAKRGPKPKMKNFVPHSQIGQMQISPINNSSLHVQSMSAHLRSSSTYAASASVTTFSSSASTSNAMSVSCSFVPSNNLTLANSVTPSSSSSASSFMTNGSYPSSAFSSSGTHLEAIGPANGKWREDEPVVENRLVLCSTEDEFLLKQDICVMCGSLGKQDDGMLIACSQCGQCYHPFCVNIKFTQVILNKGWRCLECTVCEGCGQPHDEARLLLCDDCDISYHTYCLNPPLDEVPQGTWKCNWCVMCVKCKSTSPGLNSLWQKNYTECGPCSSQITCPICNQDYLEEDLIIECLGCKRWCHAKCDGMNCDEDCEIASDFGYHCRLCRKTQDLPPVLQAKMLEYKQCVKLRSESAGSEFLRVNSTSRRSSFESLDSKFSDSNPNTSTAQVQITSTNSLSQPLNVVVNNSTVNSVAPMSTPPPLIIRPTKTLFLDGVFLSETGLNKIKSLYPEPVKKVRAKRGSKMLNVSLPSGTPLREDLDETFLNEETNSLDDSRSEPGDGFKDERRKRQRKLAKLGIGGFAARKSGRKEDDSIDMSDLLNEQTDSNTPDNKPKRKRKLKKKLCLQDAYPVCLQEAFFGRGLLDQSKENFHLLDDHQSDSDTNMEGLVGNASADQIINLNITEMGTLQSKPRSDSIISSKVFDESSCTIDDEDFQDTESLRDLLPLPQDLPQDEELMNMLMQEGDSLESKTTVTNNVVDCKSPPKSGQMNLLSPESHFNLDQIVNTSGFPQMDTKEVEDVFKGVLSPAADVHTSTSSSTSMFHMNQVNAASSSGAVRPPMFNQNNEAAFLQQTESSTSQSFDEQQQFNGPTSFTSPIQSNSQINSLDGSSFGNQQSVILNINPSSSDVDSDVGCTQSQKNMFKWEGDEPLGNLSTISPVLYANINYPNLKVEYPAWSDRLKQISKYWRQLAPDQRQPYLQKARDNRAASRIQKAEQVKLSATKEIKGKDVSNFEQQWKSPPPSALVKSSSMPGLPGSIDETPDPIMYLNTSGSQPTPSNAEHHVSMNSGLMEQTQRPPIAPSQPNQLIQVSRVRPPIDPNRLPMNQSMPLVNPPNSAVDQYHQCYPPNQSPISQMSEHYHQHSPQQQSSGGLQFNAPASPFVSQPNPSISPFSPSKPSLENRPPSVQPTQHPGSGHLQQPQPSQSPAMMEGGSFSPAHNSLSNEPFSPAAVGVVRPGSKRIMDTYAGQEPTTPRSDGSSPSGDHHFAHPPLNRSNSAPFDAYSRPPLTPRPNHDPYAYQPATPRPVSVQRSASVGGPTKSPVFSPTAASPDAFAQSPHAYDPYSKAPNTPMPRDDSIDGDNLQVGVGTPRHQLRELLQKLPIRRQPSEPSHFSHQMPSSPQQQMTSEMAPPTANFIRPSMSMQSVPQPSNDGFRSPFPPGTIPRQRIINPADQQVFRHPADPRMMGRGKPMDPRMRMQGQPIRMHPMQQPNSHVPNSQQMQWQRPVQPQQHLPNTQMYANRPPMSPQQMQHMQQQQMHQMQMQSQQAHLQMQHQHSQHQMETSVHHQPQNIPNSIQPSAAKQQQIVNQQPQSMSMDLNLPEVNEPDVKNAKQDMGKQPSTSELVKQVQETEIGDDTTTGPEDLDDDELLGLGSDFNILEYADPELDKTLSGIGGNKNNIFDEHFDELMEKADEANEKPNEKSESNHDNENKTGKMDTNDSQSTTPASNILPPPYPGKIDSNNSLPYASTSGLQPPTSSGKPYSESEIKQKSTHSEFGQDSPILKPTTLLDGLVEDKRGIEHPTDSFIGQDSLLSDQDFESLKADILNDDFGSSLMSQPLAPSSPQLGQMNQQLPPQQTQQQQSQQQFIAGVRPMMHSQQHSPHLQQQQQWQQVSMQNNGQMPVYMHQSMVNSVRLGKPMMMQQQMAGQPRQTILMQQPNGRGVQLMPGNRVGQVMVPAQMQQVVGGQIRAPLRGPGPISGSTALPVTYNKGKVSLLPAPPTPPMEIATEQDNQIKFQYESWLMQQENLLDDQQKSIEADVIKLRKTKKSWVSKQRQLKRTNQELGGTDAIEFAQVVTELTGKQKILEQVRKYRRQHNTLMTDYKTKHVNRPGSAVTPTQHMINQGQAMAMQGQQPPTQMMTSVTSQTSSSAQQMMNQPPSNMQMMPGQQQQIMKQGTPVQITQMQQPGSAATIVIQSSQPSQTIGPNGVMHVQANRIGIGGGNAGNVIASTPVVGTPVHQTPQSPLMSPSPIMHSPVGVQHSPAPSMPPASPMIQSPIYPQQNSPLVQVGPGDHMIAQQNTGGIVPSGNVVHRPPPQMMSEEGQLLYRSQHMPNQSYASVGGNSGQFESGPRPYPMNRPPAVAQNYVGPQGYFSPNSPMGGPRRMPPPPPYPSAAYHQQQQMHQQQQIQQMQAQTGQIHQQSVNFSQQMQQQSHVMQAAQMNKMHPSPMSPMQHQMHQVSTMQQMGGQSPHHHMQPNQQQSYQMHNSPQMQMHSPASHMNQMSQMQVPSPVATPSSAQYGSSIHSGQQSINQMKGYPDNLGSLQHSPFGIGEELKLDSGSLGDILDCNKDGVGEAKSFSIHFDESGSGVDNESGNQMPENSDSKTQETVSQSDDQVDLSETQELNKFDDGVKSEPVEVVGVDRQTSNESSFSLDNGEKVIEKEERRLEVPSLEQMLATGISPRKSPEIRIEIKNPVFCPKSNDIGTKDISISSSTSGVNLIANASQSSISAVIQNVANESNSLTGEAFSSSSEHKQNVLLKQLLQNCPSADSQTGSSNLCPIPGVVVAPIEPNIKPNGTSNIVEKLLKPPQPPFKSSAVEQQVVFTTNTTTTTTNNTNSTNSSSSDIPSLSLSSIDIQTANLSLQNSTKNSVSDIPVSNVSEIVIPIITSNEQSETLLKQTDSVQSENAKIANALQFNSSIKSEITITTSELSVSSNSEKQPLNASSTKLSLLSNQSQAMLNAAIINNNINNSVHEINNANITVCQVSGAPSVAILPTNTTALMHPPSLINQPNVAVMSVPQKALTDQKGKFVDIRRSTSIEMDQIVAQQQLQPQLQQPPPQHQLQQHTIQQQQTIVPALEEQKTRKKRAPKRKDSQTKPDTAPTSAKKRVRKGSQAQQQKADEDYEHFVNQMVGQLCTFPPLPIVEPAVKSNQNIWPMKNNSDLVLTGQCRLRGAFGRSFLPDEPDFYSKQLLYGGEDNNDSHQLESSSKPSSTIPGVNGAAACGYYNQEFSRVPLFDPDSSFGRSGPGRYCNYLRDADSPDSLVSMSGSEEDQFDPTDSPLKKMRLFHSNSNSPENDARSSPVIPLMLNLQSARTDADQRRMRQTPSPDNLDSERNKENSLSNGFVPAARFGNSFWPLKDSGNVSVTLTLNAGQNVHNLLNGLARLLEIKAPSSFELQPMFKSNGRCELNWVRGTARFCRFCEIVVDSNAIQKRVAVGNGEEWTFCSNDCYMQFVLSSENILLDDGSRVQVDKEAMILMNAGRRKTLSASNSNAFDYLPPMSPMMEDDELSENGSLSPIMNRSGYVLNSNHMSIEAISQMPKDQSTKLNNNNSSCLDNNNAMQIISVECKPPPNLMVDSQQHNSIIDTESSLPTVQPLSMQWRGIKYRAWKRKAFEKNHEASGQQVTNPNHSSLIVPWDATSQIRPNQLPADRRQCAFCHQNGDGAEDGPGRLLNLDVDQWVHLNCALWSSEVYETVNGSLIHVSQAVQRASSLNCVRCGKAGASLRCFKMRCGGVFHFNCALKDRCTFFKDKTLFCPVHVPKTFSIEDQMRSFSVRRRVYVSRDEQQQLANVVNQTDEQHLIRIGSLIFLSIGQMYQENIGGKSDSEKEVKQEPEMNQAEDVMMKDEGGNDTEDEDRPSGLQSFHSSTSIYPVGYKAYRYYWSMRNLRKRCRYVCSIRERNRRPEFWVEIEEDGYPRMIVRGHSPKQVWQKILRPIRKMREQADCIKLFGDYLTGDDLFGLSEPCVIRILESLPGVELLNHYKPKFSRAQLLELPLALNPSGCARTEPRCALRLHKRTHSSLQHSVGRCATLQSVVGEAQSPYQKQFVHSKSSQYRKMKLEWRNNVYLARSRIAGLGLYAARDIEKHTMVIEYIGQLIRNEIAERNERMYEQQNRRGVYMFRLDENRVLDATLEGGLARYMNHSCDPNCFADVVQIDRENKILIIANRRISRGEELCYDYRFEVEDDSRKLPCLCGAINCRKWMN